MRRLLLPLALLAAGAGAALLARPGRAEDARGYELRYVALSGEGGSAKAWFEGAPAGGARVQEALDRLTKEGFRFASLSSAWRPGVVNVSSGASPSSTTVPEPLFVLLLERGR